jgi:hypothetical protein
MAGETGDGEDGRGGAELAMPRRRHEAAYAVAGPSGGGGASPCT